MEARTLHAHQVPDLTILVVVVNADESNSVDLERVPVLESEDAAKAVKAIEVVDLDGNCLVFQRVRHGNELK